MWASLSLVTLGFLIVWFGVRDPAGSKRLAPPDESAGEVLSSGLRLTWREPRVEMGFLVRLINTAGIRHVCDHAHRYRQHIADGPEPARRAVTD